MRRVLPIVLCAALIGSVASLPATAEVGPGPAAAAKKKCKKKRK